MENETKETKADNIRRETNKEGFKKKPMLDTIKMFQRTKIGTDKREVLKNTEKSTGSRENFRQWIQGIEHCSMACDVSDGEKKGKSPSRVLERQ